MNCPARTPIAAVLTAVVLAVFAPVDGALAKSSSDAYNLQVVDSDRTAVISVSFNAPLDSESPRPTIVDNLDMAGLDQDALNSHGGDLLHATLDLPGSGFLKLSRGNLGVTVRMRKSGASDFDVEQLHKELSGRWPGLSAQAATGSDLPDSKVVTVGDRRFSFLETDDADAKSFVAMYSLPLMHDCYVEFLFQFTRKDSDADAQTAVQAHALIDQIMQSVAIKGL